MYRGDLSQGMFVWPHPLFDCFAQVDEQTGVVGPVSAQSNLKQCSDDTGRVLHNNSAMGNLLRQSVYSPVRRMPHLTLARNLQCTPLRCALAGCRQISQALIGRATWSTHRMLTLPCLFVVPPYIAF